MTTLGQRLECKSIRGAPWRLHSEAPGERNNHRNSAQLDANDVLGWTLVLWDTPDCDIRLSTSKIDRVITHGNIELNPRVLNGKLCHRLGNVRHVQQAVRV